LAFPESQLALHFLLALGGGAEYNTEASAVTAQGWPSWQQSGDSIDLGAGVDRRDALVVAAYLTDKPKQGEDPWPTR
jgi:hypothetical protein